MLCEINSYWKFLNKIYSSSSILKLMSFKFVFLRFSKIKNGANRNFSNGLMMHFFSKLKSLKLLYNIIIIIII